MSSRTPRPYADPYLAGIGLGLALLAAFVLAGRGLGASGAFASVATAVVGAVSPEQVAGSTFLRSHASPPGRDWLVIEIAGVLLGGFLSALLAGRLGIGVERGPRIARPSRLFFAFAGGALMGLAAAIARGCTSGLALTGGALLSAGSWLFLLAAFAAAYAAAPWMRRVWR